MQSSHYLRNVVYQSQSPAAVAYFDDRATSLFATDASQSYVEAYVTQRKGESSGPTEEDKNAGGGFEELIPLNNRTNGRLVDLKRDANEGASHLVAIRSIHELREFSTVRNSDPSS